jgi:hypothetical protein
VTVTAKSPVAGERPAGNVRVTARNGAEAIKKARQHMRNAGHTRQDGALTYRAERS